LAVIRNIDYDDAGIPVPCGRDTSLTATGRVKSEVVFLIRRKKQSTGETRRINSRIAEKRWMGSGGPMLQ